MPHPKYKGRYTDVYLPSQDFLLKWREQSKAKKMPLSSWIFETVERALAEDVPPELPAPSPDALHELRKLRRELELERQDSEKWRTEAFNLRHQAFLQAQPSGLQQYDDRLITLLQMGGSWPGREILRELGVSTGDADAIQIVTHQLQILQDLGLVVDSAKGWRWVG